jgi:hypothetical protein
MATIDFKKELKSLYQPSAKEVELVEVPPMSFLMADGHGDPNTASAYKEAVGNLYAVAYTLKFANKKRGGEDYTVMPLEGLWWSENMDDFVITNKSNWDWTMMIMQPPFITREMVNEARTEVQRKKKLEALPEVRLASYDEGLAAQVLYVGPYDNEGPTIARMHDFIRQNGYQLAGKHHEIYLGDPNRTAPEKLKTVIRQPIEQR